MGRSRAEVRSREMGDSEVTSLYGQSWRSEKDYVKILISIFIITQTEKTDLIWDTSGPVVVACQMWGLREESVTTGSIMVS